MFNPEIMLIEIINYSRKPRIKPLQRISFVDFIKFAIKSILLIVILSVPSSSVIKLLNLNDKLGSFPQELILVPILVAPIYEEIIFRILLRVTKLNIVLFFVTIFALIGYCLFIQNYFWLIFLGIITLGWSIYIVLNQLKIKINFKYVFYISVSIFALMHMGNFDGFKLWMFALAPIVVIPQFIMGLLFSYLRMNNGFVYAICLHAFINLIFLLPLWFN